MVKSQLRFLASAMLVTTSLGGPVAADDSKAASATPIKHIVVIFQENVAFDHYFATYPEAANPEGEPVFKAARSTPKDIDTLKNAGLLLSNPNKTNPLNGKDAALPFRLDRTQAATADQGHGYTAEQAAFNGGKMDLFPAFTGRATKNAAGVFGTKGLVMGYYDGNTVTALWNYAQHYAMNDRSFSTVFGPSTPGAINLISGQTNGVVFSATDKLEKDGSYGEGRVVPDGAGGWTLIGDLDPAGDVCSKGQTVSMTGRNIGDMLNEGGVTWGFFEGGFDLTQKNGDGSAGCDRSSRSAVTNVYSRDYIPHHQPFQYYKSTANLQHVRPASPEVVGTSQDGGANHQYDINDFFAALKAGNMPQVSFLKAPAYQDGHAGYSDPLDEQTFVVNAVNAIQSTPFWSDTAIIVMYDDSDGWYDHATNVVNGSSIGIAGYDALDGQRCGKATQLEGVGGKPVNGRCGYGTRQPFLLISPFAKPNFVDHTLTDQTSVMRFIQDNWLGGKRLGQGSFDQMAGSLDTMFDWSQDPNPPLILDPATGALKVEWQAGSK